jgi:hypothetical protein
MSIITKLESKIEDLHRGWQNAQAIINSNPTSIQEYIKLKEDTSIEMGIRYLSLEAIAEEYNLYQGDREISELKDLIGREIDSPSHADILQSVQIIRDRYRKVYECNGREFDRKAVLEMKTCLIYVLVGFNAGLCKGIQISILKFDKELLIIGLEKNFVAEE